MKKVYLLIILLITSATIFSACADDELREYSLKKYEYKPEAMFAVSDAEMFGDTLFYTDRHNIMSYNISNGKSATFAEDLDCCEAIAIHDQYLYAFDKTYNKICVFDILEKQEKCIEEISVDGASIITDFVVTDNYIVCIDDNQSAEFYITNRNEGRLDSVSIDGYSYISQVTNIDSDRVAFIGEINYIYYIVLYDINDCRIISEFELVNNVMPNSICYSELQNSIYFASQSKYVFSIKSYSLNKKVEETVRRTGSTIELPDTALGEELEKLNPSCVSAYSNVVTWYDSYNECFKFVDLNNTKESVTVASYMGAVTNDGALDLVFYNYEKEYDIYISEINYTREEFMKTDLLAGADFDIYCSGKPEYIKSGAYVDLKSFENIQQVINFSEINEFMEKTSSSCGEIFGVPIGFRYEKSEDILRDFANDKESLERMFYYYSFLSYTFNNVKLSNGTYEDSNGAVLREILQNADGIDFKKENVEPELYLGNYTMFAGDYLFLNPKSDKKEEASKLLAEILRFYTGSSSIEHSRLEEGTWSGYLYSDIPIASNMFCLYEIASDEILTYIRYVYEPLISKEISIDEAVEMYCNRINNVLSE